MRRFFTTLSALVFVAGAGAGCHCVHGRCDCKPDCACSTPYLHHQAPAAPADSEPVAAAGVVTGDTPPLVGRGEPVLQAPKSDATAQAAKDAPKDTVKTPLK